MQHNMLSSYMYLLKGYSAAKVVY